MTLQRCAISIAILVVGGSAMVLFTGCGNEGNLTETVDTVSSRDISGIAGPTDTSQLAPVARVPRSQFSMTNTAADLAFPGLNGEELAKFSRGLQLFSTDRITGSPPIIALAALFSLCRPEMQSPGQSGLVTNGSASVDE